MIDIHLHGSLKTKFKDKFRLSVESPAEGIRAICCQYPEFEQVIRRGNWQILVGNLNGENYIKDETKINSRFGHHDQMHILPAAQGAGNSSTWLGVALIGASFFMPATGLAVAGMTVSATTVGFVGAAWVTYGVSKSLADIPSYDAGSREDVAQRPSFTFDGPTNTSSEGLAVPIVIGEVLTGSVVVNAGLSVDQLPPDE